MPLLPAAAKSACEEVNLVVRGSAFAYTDSGGSLAVGPLALALAVDIPGGGDVERRRNNNI